MREAYPLGAGKRVGQVRGFLEAYRHQMGLFGRIFGEHPAIAAAERLLHPFQNPDEELGPGEYFLLARACLIEHPVREGSVVYAVFNNIFDAWGYQILQLFAQADLLTENNVSLLQVWHRYIYSDNLGLFFELRNFMQALSNAHLLSQASLDALSQPNHLIEVWRLFSQCSSVLRHNPPSELLLRLIHHPDPRVANVLFRGVRQFLTSENVGAILGLNLDVLRRIEPALGYLNHAGLLTQERFNLLLDPILADLADFQALEPLQVRNYLEARDGVAGRRDLYMNPILGTFEERLRDVRRVFRLDEYAVPRNNNERVRRDENAEPMAEEPPEPRPFNDAQSTHVASVHKSVSESALRLKARYGESLKEKGLEALLQEIRDWCMGLPSKDSDPVENKEGAAKRCVVRILDENYVFQDPVSKVGIRELYALIWLGIHDAVLVSRPEEALVLLIEGLYETQRGYNLSDTGVDQGGRDKTICVVGCFNKAVEKMQCQLPDVQLIFMTSQTALYKLQRIIPEEVRLFLERLPYAEQKEVLAQLKEDGTPEPIWEKIRQGIAHRIWDEFLPLFCSSEDPAVRENFQRFLENNQCDPTEPALSKFILFLDACKALDLDWSQFSNLSFFDGSPRLSRSSSILCPSPRSHEDEGVLENNNNSQRFGN